MNNASTVGGDSLILFSVFAQALTLGRASRVEQQVFFGIALAAALSDGATDDITHVTRVPHNGRHN